LTACMVRPVRSFFQLTFGLTRMCRRAMDLDLKSATVRADRAEALALICLDPISATARADRAEALAPAVAVELVGIASLCHGAPIS
jgi:hypothetical protein